MTSSRAQHSTNFLAAPFRGVNLITALRFVGRTSGRVVYASRFGSLMFMPFSFTGTPISVNTLFYMGQDSSSTAFDTPNTISVSGKSHGLNASINVKLQDRSTQGTQGDDTVREMARPIHDPTLTNISAARKMARSILRSNNTHKTSRTITGLPEMWFARAGDNAVLSDSGDLNIIVQTVHDISDKSTDLTVLSADAGLQGVLQHLEEEIVSARPIDVADRTGGVIKSDMSFNFSNLVKMTYILQRTDMRGTKFTIGASGASVERGSKIGQGGYVLGVRNGKRRFHTISSGE